MSTNKEEYKKVMEHINDLNKKISLIISVYNKYDYLECVLNSIEKQTYRNFEVIIAEDCQKIEMLEHLNEWKKKYNFLIKHVSQEDIGFRKTKILNKAILKSEGKYILVIDGDCVLHKQYLKKYFQTFNKGYDVVFGRRCEMSEKLSKKILLQKGNKNIKLLDLIFPYSKAWTESVYIPFFLEIKKRTLRILGSNVGFTKDIIYKINGFNEDYEGAGIGEDTDLEWRFIGIGAKYKSIKNKAVQYHIFHGREGRHDTIKGDSILKESRNKNAYFCKNGLNKYRGENETTSK